ncbi:serine/threonine-protein kinase [Candidatus Uabimicrobium amorphum]|uniref:non-specific serine/threonine protein kinase n=1 Tax=Uabimicrobium amorphum TaxID=2596890 RepID=A0A5S9IS63_UABAM|nr:serine/threonine-protein kinase [Candidatus Uabimicrobium amorphum]BBM86747.1 protein kinase [Candidatus Uabimicrobium amorphum]
MQNKIAERNKNIAQCVVHLGFLNQTAIRQCISYCNQNSLSLEQFLLQKKMLSTSQLQNIYTALNQQQDVDIKEKRWGDYIIVREIARGGMGVVYEAIQEKIKRKVAIKILLSTSSVQEIRRFIREAKLSSTIKHPNVVPIYDMGEYEGRLFLVMQYIPGKTFREFLSTNDSLSERMRIIEAMASALAAAHEKGIVHRDIKPSNILIDANDTPYLADFGLAKSMKTESQYTQTSHILGTPFYMSPEQTKTSKVSYASDVFSLGVVMYEALTNQRPFDAQNQVTLSNKICNEKVIAPRKINPEIPTTWEKICLHTLEKKPQDRYKSAVELVNDLQRAQHGESLLVSSVLRFKKITQLRTLLLYGSAFLVIAITVMLTNGYIRFGNTNTKVQENASLLFQKGQEAFAKQNFEQAFALITRSIEKKTSFEKYVLQLRCLEKQQNYAALIENAQQLQKKYNNRLQIQKLQLLHATGLWKTKRQKAAYDLVHKVYKTSPSAECLLLLVKTSFDLKMYGETQQYLQELVKFKLDKNGRGEMFLYLGATCFAQKKYRVAKEYLFKSLSHFPLKKTHRFLGQIFFAEKKPEQAIKHLSQSLEERNNDEKVLRLLAQSYQNAKNFKEAKTTYDEMIDLSPWKAEYFYQRAMCYTQLNQIVAARDDFLKSIEINRRQHNAIMELHAHSNNYPMLMRYKTNCILDGVLVNFFENFDVDILHKEKKKIALDVVRVYREWQREKIQTYNKEYVQKFLKIIAADNSGALRQIAIQGIETMYRSARMLKDIRAQENTTPALKKLQRKIQKRHVDHNVALLNYLVTRYKFFNDKSALQPLFLNRKILIRFAPQLLRSNSIILNLWILQTLMDLATPGTHKAVEEIATQNSPNAILALSLLHKHGSDNKAQPKKIRQNNRYKEYLVHSLVIRHAPYTFANFMTYPNDKVRLLCAEKLWQKGDQKARKVIRQYFKSQDIHIRRYAYKVYFTANKEHVAQAVREDISLLKKGIYDKDHLVQQICLNYLSQFRQTNILRDLIKVSQDKQQNEVVRAYAVLGLLRKNDVTSGLRVVCDPQEKQIIRAAFVYADLAKILEQVDMLQVLTMLPKLSLETNIQSIPTIAQIAGERLGASYVRKLLRSDSLEVQISSCYGAFVSKKVSLMKDLQQVIGKTENPILHQIASGALFATLVTQVPKKRKTFHSWVKKQSSAAQKGAAFGYAFPVFDMGKMHVCVRKLGRWDNNLAYQNWGERIDQTLLSRRKDKALLKQYRNFLVEANALNSEAHEYLFCHAVASHYLKKDSLAMKSLKKALKLKPNMSFYWYYLAKIRHDNQQYKRARRAVEKALQLSPLYTKAQDLYVKILQQYGEKKLLKKQQGRLKLLLKQPR